MKRTHTTTEALRQVLKVSGLRLKDEKTVNPYIEIKYHNHEAGNKTWGKLDFLSTYADIPTRFDKRIPKAKNEKLLAKHDQPSDDWMIENMSRPHRLEIDYSFKDKTPEDRKALKLAKAGKKW